MSVLNCIIGKNIHRKHLRLHRIRLFYNSIYIQNNQRYMTNTIMMSVFQNNLNNMLVLSTMEISSHILERFTTF